MQVPQCLFVRVVCPYTVFDGVPVRFSLFVHELFDREPVCFSAICVYMCLTENQCVFYP